MNVLIDNKDLYSVYGITVLDYTNIFAFPAERENERVWEDKSGVDKNLTNIRFEPKEFVLSCYCKASNESLAYELVNTLIEYMFSKGLFVISLRDTAKSIRQCFLCERSNTIVPEVHIREQNSLYSFKLGLKDINPNCIKYYNIIAGLATTINYVKGQTANIFWGDGNRAIVSNSGNYVKTGYVANGLVDIIIDLDKNAAVVLPLIAEFTVDVIEGARPLSVQFSDLSTGSVEIWSWNFGDGTTSSEQSPSHTYTEPGIYTVILQIFNSAKGHDTETKISYISVRNARILINSTDCLLKNSTERILKN
jgi:hypothetical protein